MGSRNGIGKRLGLEGGALVSRISALIKQAPRELPCPFHQVSAQLDGTISEPESGLLLETKPASVLLSDFQNCEQLMSVAYEPVCGILS